MIQFATLLILLILTTSPQEAIKTTSLTVVVKEIKNTKGQLGISVYSSPDGWPGDWKQAYKAVLAPIEGEPTSITIPDLPEGTYAISVIHDENSNTELDMNFMSIPKEGYGVSNNVKAGMFGPPKFEKSTVDLAGRENVVSIILNY